MVPRVGDWVVQGELARGGQGVVLRARHAVHGTQAALKLLLRVELKAVLRFRQEASVLWRLNHPNLVRVFEAGDHEGAPFLAMELVEGQSLADLVRTGGPPPFGRTVELLAAVARAVDHCHGHGVVHRDVKPENIIVERPSGRPVLVDFGLAKRDRELFGSLSIDDLTRLSRSGELRGTPAFMAPEQVSPEAGPGDVGPWTDVYALGATLHVLLTGEAPCDADSLPELVRAILSDPPADPRARNPAVPAPLARLCAQAMAKARAERPPSAAAFAAALEVALRPARRPARKVTLLAALVVVVAGGSPPASARPAGPGPRRRRRSRRSPTRRPRRPPRRPRPGRPRRTGPARGAGGAATARPRRGRPRCGRRRTSRRRPPWPARATRRRSGPPSATRPARRATAGSPCATWRPARPRPACPSSGPWWGRRASSPASRP